MWMAADAFPDEDSVETGILRKRFGHAQYYLPLQYAGNIGVISLGVGYGAKRDLYQLSLVYGYAPASMAGVRIHTITAKNIFHLYRFRLNEKQTLLPYAALGLSFEIGGRSFFTQPANMPPSYYDYPKSMHFIPSAGLKMRYITPRYKALRGIEIFAEATTVDAYVFYKFLSDEVKMHQIITLAAGVHLLKK
jgi:hypothetical protein